MSTHVTDPAAPLVSASFRAKSAAVSLVLTLVFAAYYAANAVGLGSGDPAGPVPAGAGTLAIVTLILFVVLQIVLQTVLAIGAGRVEAFADADRHAAAQGRRAAYPVLLVGALATFGAAFVGAGPFCLANLALAGFVAGEVVRMAAELLAYRRG